MFGAILTERLQATGREVVEAAKMPAGNRRGEGESDGLDAVFRCSSYTEWCAVPAKFMTPITVGFQSLVLEVDVELGLQ